jgi:hypothetical protein
MDSNLNLKPNHNRNSNRAMAIVSNEIDVPIGR